MADFMDDEAEVGSSSDEEQMESEESRAGNFTFFKINISKKPEFIFFSHL